MVLANWNESNHEILDKKHPDVGGWTFERIYEQRPKYIKFVLIWYDVTGPMKKFHEYCKARNESTKCSSDKLD